jgi:FtsH-binding integral membrane protein
MDPAAQPRWPAPQPPGWWAWLARLAQAVLVAVGLVVLWRWPAVFYEWAHDIAAIAMFVAIIFVAAHYAWYSARRPKRPEAPPRRITQAYVAIVGVMTGALVLAVLLQPGGLVLIVEAILVTGFAAFWCVQTVDLWENEDKYCRIGHTRSSRRRSRDHGAVG